MMDHTEPSFNIARHLVERARSQPSAQAFIEVDETGRTQRVITYRHLEELVAACAGGLRARGINRGDAVVCFVPMSLELYVTFLALLRLGAIITFIDPWGGRSMLESAAALVKPVAFIGIPKSLVLLARSRTLRRLRLVITTGKLRIPRTTRFARLIDTAREDWVTAPVDTTATDHALITFTSGSTGAPKGADRTHGFLQAQHDVLEAETKLTPTDVVFTNLPIVVLHALGRGACTVLAPGSISQNPEPDSKPFHQLVTRSQATILVLSPTPLRQLTRAPGRGTLPSVRRIYTGGGPVLPDLLDAARSIAPTAEIIALYGSTESEPIAHAPADDVLARREQMRRSGGIFVGRDVDSVELRIIRSTDRPITIDPGGSIDDWSVSDQAPGEIIVAGPHVNRSYLGNERAVRENKIRDEHGVVWHRTGDIGRRDSTGALWLLGRRGAGINIDGRRVWPLEIETPILDLPEVERAALCTPKFDGAGREFKNAAAVLAIQPAAGFTRTEAAAAVVANLRERHLDGAIEVRTLSTIPMDKRHAAKVDTEQLTKLLKPQVHDDY